MLHDEGKRFEDLPESIRETLLDSDNNATMGWWLGDPPLYATSPMSYERMYYVFREAEAYSRGCVRDNTP